MHITSLPSQYGSGDIGPEAYAFADWLALAGVRVWQMLPIGPIGAGNSPYSSSSSFAIEPLFLALEPLIEAGLLAKDDLEASVRASKRLTAFECDYDAARAFRMPLYMKASAAFTTRNGAKSKDFKRFVERASWLPAWLDRAAGSDEAARAMHSWIQFELERQWSALRSYCSARGIALVGDVPIFVTADSADVRENPTLFRLRKDGQPEVLTGVPPDDFSADGQLWGHPHYAWPAHAKQKFAWWIARIAIASQRFDLVRIDHFIGFMQAYEVPFGAKNARRGAWAAAPGRALLEAMAKEFPCLPLIAEDLGALTKDVEALRDDFALAGMRIVQNAFWSGQAGDMPHNHPHRAVVYSGTHDNETTVQWWKSRDAAQKKRFLAYAGNDPVHEAMSRIVLASPAALAVLPMQDVLGLGKSARMNLPGQSEGQWRWQMEAGAAHGKNAAVLRANIEATGRC
jgi:4-alpha-glucanotransferase